MPVVVPKQKAPATRRAPMRKGQASTRQRAAPSVTSLSSPSKLPVKSSRDDAALARYQAALASRASFPLLKVTQPPDGKGPPTVQPDHATPGTGAIIQMNAVSMTDPALFSGFIGQLVNVSCRGQKVSEPDLNFMLAMVVAVRPRDEVEALLASQMAAVHNAVMTAARRLAHVDTIQQQDSASAMFNKLARTYTAQIESLKRYRATGEQNIRVQHQHVTVNEGGQAIVGDVSSGGGGVRNDSRHQPHAHEATRPVAASGGATVHGDIQALAPAVPVSGGQGVARVPDARRSRRSPKGASQRALRRRPAV